VTLNGVTNHNCWRQRPEILHREGDLVTNRRKQKTRSPWPTLLGF